MISDDLPVEGDELPTRHPWFPGWLERLQGRGYVEQVIGVWLAAQADSAGVIEAVDWPRLVMDTGLGDTVVRKSLRPNGRMVAGGLVDREQRFLTGRASAPTRYTLLLVSEGVR